MFNLFMLHLTEGSIAWILSCSRVLNKMEWACGLVGTSIRNKAFELGVMSSWGSVSVELLGCYSSSEGMEQNYIHCSFSYLWDGWLERNKRAFQDIVPPFYRIRYSLFRVHFLQWGGVRWWWWIFCQIPSTGDTFLVSLWIHNMFPFRKIHVYQLNVLIFFVPCIIRYFQYLKC